MNNTDDYSLIKTYLINRNTLDESQIDHIKSHYIIKRNDLTNYPRIIYEICNIETGKLFLYKINMDDSKMLIGNKLLHNIDSEYFPILYEYYDKSLNYKIDDIAALEYVNGIDLFTFINSIKYNQQSMKKIVYDICCAIKYLHSLDIIHRDIKSENIVIDVSSRAIKIIDFDMATKVDPITKIYKSDTYVGTQGFLHQHTIETKIYSFKSDVFALGIIIYEMATMDLPYLRKNGKHVFTEILINDNFFLKKYIIMLDLIKKILITDIDLIPDIKDVLTHEWFA